MNICLLKINYLNKRLFTKLKDNFEFICCAHSNIPNEKFMRAALNNHDLPANHLLEITERVLYFQNKLCKNFDFLLI